MPTRNFKSNGIQAAIDVDKITRDDLKDDRRFALIYREFVRRKWYGLSRIAFQEFASYAEKALDEDKYGTPGRLFAALIKKDEHRITQAQEDRALGRFPATRIYDIIDWIKETAAQSAEKKDLTEKTSDTSLLTDRNIGFLPIATVQCFFPQKRLPGDQRLWQVSHGNATLAINAGAIATRDNPNTMHETNVPYGRLARLLFAYVIGQAVKTRSPTIDMGHSLRQFMRRIGITIDGRAGKNVTEAVEDLAAASFILGGWGDGAVHTQYARVVDEISFWIQPDDGQRTFWTPEIVLSDKFHAQVQAHRMPVDMDHLARLMRSPRRMDLYTWLSYKTGVIPRRRAVQVPLRDLQPLFAPDISDPKDVKKKLRADLKAIAHVWPNFDTEMQGDMLVLRWSESPVPRTRQISGISRV